MTKTKYQKDLNAILADVRGYYPGLKKEQEQKITDAFLFSEISHADQKRFSGEPYITHPIAATRILLSIRPDVDTICACLLHDVLEDTDVTSAEMEERFGPTVRFLCEGVAKVSKVQLKENEKGERQLRSLKKLFIAVAQDIRVIFVKLADRIHNLQTLEHVRKDKRERIAQESLNIYAPVAGKLGLSEFMKEIEDLCFRAVKPDIYDQLISEIEQIKIEKEKFFQEAIKEIVQVFAKERLKIVEIHARQKHPASLYRKMKRKNLSSAHEVYDLFGLRIIVSSKNTCYRALGVLHSKWKPMPGRFKDYISVPKPNGYQSLHTTVLGLADSTMPTEVQIRTQQMHLDAEFGPAAHWAYKQKSQFDKDYIQRTQWFPDHLKSQDQMDPDAFYEQIMGSILEDQIYVFTPRGDTKILPKGATPIDFAYSIHSEVGHSCVGARVNGIIRPLSYQLQNGQIVEMLTKKGRMPNPAWLDFVKSTSARAHIRNAINKEQGIEPAPAEDAPAQKKTPVRPTTPAKKKKEEVQSDPIVVIGGEEGVPYKFAHCCKPKLGKDIVAYKSRGLDFTIHEVHCEGLEQLEPERLLEAHFIIPVKILIKAYDRVGLLRDYADLMAQRGMNILDLSNLTTVEKQSKVVQWNMTLEARSEAEVQDLLHALEKTQSVFEVKRV